jgi:hypothetical protein
VTATATAERIGIVRGLPAAEYHADPGASSTLLRKFARSALHARYEMLHGSEQTEPQAEGEAIHTAVLEPMRFEMAYARGPAERRTKAGRDAYDVLASAGKIVLKAGPYDDVLNIRDAVNAHETAGALLAASVERELSVFWTEHGRRCKARLDLVTTFVGWTWVVDIKGQGDGLADASPDGFARACAQYGYHVQAAWYLRALDKIAPHPRRFAWIAVEKAPPHAVAVYEPSEAMLAQGASQAEQYFQRLRHAEETGNWPGYIEGIRPLDLPKWAQRGDES